MIVIQIDKESILNDGMEEHSCNKCALHKRNSIALLFGLWNACMTRIVELNYSGEILRDGRSSDKKAYLESEYVFV